MNKIFNSIILLLLMASCAQQENKQVISDINDYQQFLNQPRQDLTQLNQQVDLWKSKIELEPDGFLFYEKLGSTYHAIFEKTRKIQYLHLADSTYLQAEKLTRGKWKVPSLMSLSSLSAKKHDFEAAANYAVRARELTDKKFGALLMQFDAEMELGNYQMAGAILNENKRMDSFDYLVRLSKYKDYEGDLDSAIYYMEEAKARIPASQKEKLLWATVNLGDMYGHAGRVKDSYQNYLTVLKLDPEFDYALKGIAWVAYSHDEKRIDAITILESLKKRSGLPDYHLQLAELYEQEGRDDVAQRLKDQFVIEASKVKYLGMYNKYLIELHTERGAYVQAISLAKEEIKKRPTPATYDWLAWVLHQKGETAKALRIYKEHVEGRTYEPDAIFHMGVVYHESGDSKGLAYLKESLDARYELGPQIARQIKKKING